MAIVDGESERFCMRVFDRCDRLVESRIWSGISSGSLRNWIQQFDQFDARLLAATLLDNLIYRSRAQFMALLENLIVTFRNPSDPDACDLWLVDALQSRDDPRIRFAPVIRNDQPPTKSATYVMRLLQRQFRMRDEWLIWPQAIEALPEDTLVFLVDDLSGTGDQFLRFWQSAGLQELNAGRPDLRFHLFTTAIHQSAIRRITELIPAIRIVCSEILGPQHHFFTGTSLSQYKSPELISIVQSLHTTIVDRTGLGGGRVTPMGYGGMGLCYAFEHATPNNTLPIFWQETSHWQPLLQR